jgi:hypothetical protein
MAASVISFLSVLDSINLNHLSRQNEQDTKRADTKPIAVAFVSEFEHVAAEIVAHRFHPLPNIPTHVFGQSSQLLASFLADLNSIPHQRDSSLSFLPWQACESIDAVLLFSKFVMARAPSPGRRGDRSPKTKSHSLHPRDPRLEILFRRFAEFLEERIIPERIEHRIALEQRGSEGTVSMPSYGIDSVGEERGHGTHGLAAAFGITPIFCAKAMKRGSSL